MTTSSKSRDRGRRHRLVLAMSVWMVTRPAGWPAALTPIRPTTFDAVGERVEAVGQDADRAAGVPERDLRDRDGDVEEEDASDHAGDREPRPECGPVPAPTPRPQKTRAVGTGHHRSCTLPMMYFFGTIPQCRLSELLLR